MSPNQNSSRSLPAKASEEYLRKEAKRLARRRGVSLGIAQRTLAREYGHRNWAELIAAANTTLQPAAASSGSGAPLRNEEWATILSLADASLTEMPNAPDMKEWLDNRRSFPDSGGIQQQIVATLGGQIVGYACVEHPPAWMRDSKGAAGQYRLFVVVEPWARRSLGIRMLAKLRESLIGLGARGAWFQEYEADTGLISFLEERGFVRARGFAKATSFPTGNGTRIVRLFMDAPFEPLAHQGPTQSLADDLHEEEPR
jgi:hypothetical protein